MFFFLFPFLSCHGVTENRQVYFRGNFARLLYIGAGRIWAPFSAFWLVYNSEMYRNSKVVLAWD